MYVEITERPGKIADSSREGEVNKDLMDGRRQLAATLGRIYPYRAAEQQAPGVAVAAFWDLYQGRIFEKLC